MKILKDRFEGELNCNNDPVPESMTALAGRANSPIQLASRILQAKRSNDAVPLDCALQMILGLMLT